MKRVIDDSFLKAKGDLPEPIHPEVASRAALLFEVAVKTRELLWMERVERRRKQLLAQLKLFEGGK